MRKAQGRRGSAGKEPEESAGDLKDYARKRDFSLTREPPPGSTSRRPEGALRFVVQKHAARRLHYDFRLELEGTLKSWAIPKGPSLDPTVKRLAVHVEDHPLDYADFEGHIPEGQYGGGDVIVWDRGAWEPLDEDPVAAYRAGALSFRLAGEKLNGRWKLVRTRRLGSDKEQWLLMKHTDAAARAESEYDIVAERPESVITGGELPPRKPKATASGTKAKSTAAAGSSARASGAVPLPEWIGPELATPVDAPPPGDWRYELKFDGYRMLARVEGGKAKLFTRNGNDWTARLGPLGDAVESLGLQSAWLDGEIVVTDENGIPDFQALQNALDEGRNRDLQYFLFDLPYIEGEDLRPLPLETRRERLRGIFEGHEQRRLHYSQDFAVAPREILAAACEMEIEGLIGKRAGSPYRSARCGDWIKLKCRLRQECVIVGYSAPQGEREGFGALLLAVREREGKGAGGLHYAGRVGTGFTAASLKSMHERMQGLVRAKPAVGDAPTGSEVRGVTWLEPQLLCEVEFSGWTREGLVRQAAFRGLREDKTPAEAVRERVEPSASVTEAASRPGRKTRKRPVAEVAGIAISNAERVIDEASGTTKGELAAFYCRIAERLLPHLAGRPLSIMRAPSGLAGERFFQRHAEKLAIPDVTLLPPELDPDGERLMQVDSLEAIVGAVQMGTVEFHTWNATSDRIERPDRIVFDLDPDPALPWSRMIEATNAVLVLLDELGLASFLKTSGGKGMHIVVPLARRQGWDELKGFAKAISQHLARLLPKRFADRMGPQNRVGRIFVDYLRNQRSASTVAAYSVRARPGLPVSVPIARDELERIHGAAEWTVANLEERLDTLARDPWEGYANRQQVTRAMRERLGAA